jgi:HAD superfamily hydrolase (TIGR01509 family)
LGIRALFFDFDGVLWDSEVASLRSWQETFRAHGAEMSLELYGRMLGTIGGADPLDELEHMIGRSVDREEVQQRRWRRKLELVGRLEPRPGVRAYLDEARRRGLGLAVVSTDDMEWITTGLSILGLLQVWDFIECAGGDPARAKPSPALYLAALHRLHLTPHEAIAIEDSPNGIRAAKDAGLYCLAFANDVSRRFDLTAADARVDSLEELPLDELIRMAGSG